MKYFLVFLVFVVGEITIGEALRCHKCEAEGKKDCTGKSVLCSNKDDVCIKKIVIDIINGVNNTVASKGCSNKTNLCNGPAMAQNKNFLKLSVTKCCNKDNCNRGKIEMPVVNTTENGVTCMTCFERGSTKCKNYEPFKCRGNAKECMEYIGDKSGRPNNVGKPQQFAIVACSSPSGCNNGYDDSGKAQVAEHRILRCNDKYKKVQCQGQS
ncbi:phospholipase A2 inhibitor and Ly6/PLAUR domain-containing protein-like [Anomaloglossus baeobatrachus]|uniref:phospholipase A2 inhibitor and Ly6/PLAUR domain-containing protein-like n=1 Tax=Anomaloglossus baeobatrachus TaxID=238106 RepID=UPI003F4FA9B9